MGGPPQLGAGAPPLTGGETNQPVAFFAPAYGVPRNDEPVMLGPDGQPLRKRRRRRRRGRGGRQREWRGPPGDGRDGGGNGNGAGGDGNGANGAG
jgi:hypothetical protein